MKTDVQLFNFNDHELSTVVDENGNPWFRGDDICSILGYQNPWDAIKRHCKTFGLVKHEVNSGKGKRMVTFLNEGNLYRLILKSNNSEAEPFEAFVCDKVLPSIRKTGRYEMPPVDDEKHSSSMPGFVNLIISENVIMRVIPDKKYVFLVPTKEIARAMNLSAEGIRTQKCIYKNALIEGVHYLNNYTIVDRESGVITIGTVYTYEGTIWYSEHIRRGNAWDLRAWAVKARRDNLQMYSGLPDQETFTYPAKQIVSVMGDVCLIEDKNLRVSIAQKLAIN